MSTERLTRREQRAQNRLNLLEAAEVVFAERGIQGATLDEVAAEAGLTKGAVYSNFAGKEDLVLAVMRHRMGQEAQAQAQRLGCPPDPERLVAEFGAHWAESVREQERYGRVVLEFMVHATRHPSAREELVRLMFPQEGSQDPHPLAPPGSLLASLPADQADAVLKALDVGMWLLATLAPERCPPELFGTALRLLAQREGQKE
ncbi:TetR/AcrR family transcriptional regulator [Nonomuraea typhae]|uniref:TetR/AcrR family transcriptional regulator n=1 Tax=Nonomuraea typhae TaxID=2603600 RepID=UPI001C66A9B9|nr:TetR/AcrR family transcriptional regulator [Nonomuraea typhae]